MSQHETFYILITSKNTENIQKGYSDRSKAYTTREIVEQAATEYIERGYSKSYYIMECIGMIRKKPVDIELYDAKTGESKALDVSKPSFRVESVDGQD